MKRLAILWLLAGFFLLPGCGGSGGDKNFNAGKDIPVPDQEKKVALLLMQEQPLSA